MTLYSEKEIEEVYGNQIKKAYNCLKTLKVYCGKELVLRGLNGWVFEQVIQHCLIKELEEKSLPNLIFEEQVTFHGRKKADLKINNIIIEIKKEGLFGKDDITKYKEYKKIADENGLIYLYITGGERVEEYITGTIEAFGKNNSFFLDEYGHWKKFVNRITSLV